MVLPDWAADAYLFIIFADVFYLFALLFGGVYYTRKTTVKCPRCGIRISKYRIETHQCHPGLVGYQGDRSE